MRKSLFLSLLLLMLAFPGLSYAQGKVTLSPSPTPSLEAEATPTLTPTPDLTQKTEETLGPLEELLKNQQLGPVWPLNPIKYAIRSAVDAGIPVNMIVLLLLLPIVATVIASARHLIGFRGFGIFLPASLSVVFVATGPIVGIALFLLIISVSWFARFILKKLKVKLQYLPKAALLLWAVSFGVLALMLFSPVYKIPGIENVSIFPVLILALLAEDFMRIQLGKSFKTAFSLTTETIILALISYFVLTFEFVREFALLNPEKLLLGVLIVDFVLGKYVGLRVFEIWRFRKLIKS